MIFVFCALSLNDMLNLLDPPLLPLFEGIVTVYVTLPAPSSMVSEMS